MSNLTTSQEGALQSVCVPWEAARRDIRPWVCQERAGAHIEGADLALWKGMAAEALGWNGEELRASQSAKAGVLPRTRNALNIFPAL